MNPNEAETLVSLAKGAEVCVEIGVNEGLTAAHLMAEIESIKWYFGVDVNPGYVPAKKVQKNEVPKFPGHYAMHWDKFTPCIRDRGSLDLLPEKFPQQVDFMFIDGDHGAAAVAWDTFIASSIVRDNGIVVWHDYHHLGTVDVADILEILDHGEGKLKHIEGTWLVYSTGKELRELLAQFNGQYLVEFGLDKLHLSLAEGQASKDLTQKCYVDVVE